MADINSHTKTQRLHSEINSPSTPTPSHLNPTSKYFSNFLYKALIVTIFLLIIPLFPSQAPESINQAVSTRSWELLHLLFVGIAVSYGLFSRKTDETEKEHGTSKFDNAQSYVSRLLQVSSVFDEEAETPTGSGENKVQTWSHQYFRNEPVVVVAQENSAIDEQRGNISSRIGEKTLFLPVRSLKSVEFSNGDGDLSGSVSRSNSNLGSKRISRNGSKTRNGESRGLNSNPMDSEEKVEENGVLPSPIPWRSRSGRMEYKEEVDGNGGGPPLHSFPPAMEEFEFNGLESRFLKPQTSKPSNPNSTYSSQSPKKPSPSPSLSSSELQAKNVEDPVRKKSFHKSTPPPAPPPPPPMSRKPPVVKPNSSSTNNGGMYSEKEFRRRSTSELMDFGTNGGEDMLRRVNSASDVKPRTQIDSSLMGKSVRTARVGDSFGSARKSKEFFEDGMDDNDVEAVLVEKTGKKTVRFDQTLVRPDKPSRESIPIMPKTRFSDFQKEEKKEPIDEVIVETDDESESDDDSIGRNSDSGGGDDSKGVSDGGPDVDKKADEFIAKFREQIRLQRIASIKRSSGQINRNSPR